MAKIRITFGRFSAFYSPLILTDAAGLLKAEGLEPELTVTGEAPKARARLLADETDIMQSSVSSAWGPLEKGQDWPIVHFAQINERDGFFIAGRKPEPDFAWSRLKGRSMVIDHGRQPNIMFRYACHKVGLDYDSIQAIDAGGTKDMIQAFRDGKGDYVHLQGPAPQQFEKDGIGHVVASVGEAIGKIAFSTVAAKRDWVGSEMSKAFTRAYTKARRMVNEMPAAEIAKLEQRFFPDVDPGVLAGTIAAYQKLGNWNPRVEIDRESYEAALDCFLHAGDIARRHAYEAVVVPPPAD